MFTTSGHVQGAAGVLGVASVLGAAGVLGEQGARFMARGVCCCLAIGGAVARQPCLQAATLWPHYWSTSQH